MPTTRRTLHAGPLALELEVDAQGRLCGVTLPQEVPADLSATDLAHAIGEMQKYPLATDGPPFMERVWERMAAIPWGSALTYGELAAEAGSPKASRAVGQACNKNRLPIIIPCHRVLASEGPGGFAYGPAWKAKLLELESEPQP